MVIIRPSVTHYLPGVNCIPLEAPVLFISYITILPHFEKEKVAVSIGNNVAFVG
jgi:hypothetical protein